MYGPIWQALAAEAGLAAEHIGMGTTALGRANYAERAYYPQAFFALSTGFERATKLAILVDHALENEGTFPDSKVFRDYGHDLASLLSAVEHIAERRGWAGEDCSFPRSQIHYGIIETLNAFATNATRYYNLDMASASADTTDIEDPIASWYERVTIPVLDEHCKKRSRERIEADAQQVAAMTAGHILVRHTAETGEPITSAYEAARRTGEFEFVRPWERMYVLQIARFVAEVLDRLGGTAQGELENVPYLGEFFVMFRQGDDRFRSRKTWSIYGP